MSKRSKHSNRFPVFSSLEIRNQKDASRERFGLVPACLFPSNLVTKTLCQVNQMNFFNGLSLKALFKWLHGVE